MLLCLDLGIISPRSPCNPLPRFDITKVALALIFLQRCLSVLYMACLIIFSIILCGKNIDSLSIMVIEDIMVRVLNKETETFIC